MNIIKKIFFTITLFILLPLAVYADCESDFKAIEKEFKISYKYNYDTDDFTITLVNPYYERYTWLFKTEEELKNSNMTYSDDKKILTHTIKNYKNTSYEYAIIAIYGECENVMVKMDTLTIKKDNRYAYSPLCEGYEDFVLCQKEYDKTIDEETFKSRLEAYKKDKVSKKEDDSSDSTDNTENKISNTLENIKTYIENNVLQVVIVATFIIVLIISIIIFAKYSAKSRRLE